MPEALTLPELPEGTPLEFADAAPSTFTPLDVKALKIMASPFIWFACKDETLISKHIVAPFCVVPFSTAAGCGCPAGGAFAAGTGIIPRAERAAKDDDGNCTGIGATTDCCVVGPGIGAATDEVDGGLGVVAEDAGIVMEEVVGVYAEE